MLCFYRVYIPCQSASAGSTSAKKISHRGSLDGKFVSVFLGQICLALSFFFLVSWLNSFLGQKFQMRRGAQTGGMKIFWEFFFSIFQKSLEILQFGKLCKKHFFNFPFNLHIIIVVLASYVRCKMAVYQYDDRKLQSTIKQQSLIKSR